MPSILRTDTAPSDLMRSMTCCTRISGADAPAVRPMRPLPSIHAAFTPDSSNGLAVAAEAVKPPAGQSYAYERVDSGDKLRIFVYGQPNLSRSYTVDHSGKITVPLIGNVNARGAVFRPS